MSACYTHICKGSSCSSLPQDEACGNGMQVMRVIVKQLVMEWHEQAQNVVSGGRLFLFAAMQLSLDLHFLAASLHPYTTPAGASLLRTCHSLLEQAVSHRLCNEDEQCRQVQQAYGSPTPAQSVAAWLSQLGKQAVEGVSNCSFVMYCLVEGAALGQAAMSAPVPSPLTHLASLYSRLAPDDSASDMPPSPRQRLVAHRPVSSMQSRLIGKTASSAAALVALQGKFAAPSTPRSPTIKAVHQTPSYKSVLPVHDALHHQTSYYDGAELAASQGLTSKLNRLTMSGSIDGDGLRSASRAGSTWGRKDRHNRNAPPVLQPQTSISLNAIAAIRRPAPLRIPVQA